MGAPAAFHAEVLARPPQIPVSPLLSSPPLGLLSLSALHELRALRPRLRPLHDMVDFDKHVRRGHTGASTQMGLVSQMVLIMSSRSAPRAVVFGLIIFFSIIEVRRPPLAHVWHALHEAHTGTAQLADSAWLVSRFNLRHDYLSTAVRDRTRFLLFTSCWTIFFSLFYFALFIHSPTGGILTSVLSHAV